MCSITNPAMSSQDVEMTSPSTSPVSTLLSRHNAKRVPTLHAPSGQTAITDVEIPRDALVMVEQLGHGEFGDVFRCVFLSSVNFCQPVVEITSYIFMISISDYFLD